MWGRFFIALIPGIGYDKLINQITAHLGRVRVIKGITTQIKEK